MGGRQSRRCRASRWLPWVASLLALAVAPAASARVALVATGTPEAVFIGIPRNEVVARLALPGPSRAVAVSRDGNRGYVSAGSEIVALDVNHRSETGRSNWGAGQPEIIDLELARSGDVLYAVRGSQLLALDPLTLGQRAVVELGAVARQLAVAPDGATAAVALRGGRVAMLSLRGGRLLRHVALQGAVGVAISDSGMTYVTARRRLRLIAAGQRRARKRAIALPAGAGGWLALSPGRSKLVVGAAPRGRAAALVELERLKVRRLVSGTGPGRAAWDPTASRIALADAGSGSVSLVSPFTRGRVLLIPLPGTTPTDVVVQPGLALIMGSDLADRITGSRGDDEIRGLEGDDVLRGGRGRDVLEGGPGADQLSGGANSDRATGDEGDDFLVGGNGDDKLFGGPGSDGADGGTGNDTIHGDDGDDTLDGGDGDDTILGGEGDDTIVEKGFGDDKLLDGGPGNDLIKGGRGSDQVIRGGPGNDRLYGETGSERIRGGDGDDFIDGGRAGDRLEGDDGNDTILGDAGNDHLYGGRGDDKLDAGSGDDELVGHEGDDLLIGGSGPDAIRAGPGNDTIRAADDSIDTIDCGEGDDTVYVEIDAPGRDLLSGCETVVAIAPERDSDVTVANTIRGTRHADVLRGTAIRDSIFGRGGSDRIYGYAGDDYLDGDRGNDRLHGGAGSDTIAGRYGNDVIWGDAGNDHITGDRGDDRIFGGTGNDRIYGNIGYDRIDGGSGNDRINVVDHRVDRVTCGPGRDIVFADPVDRVARDCESVRR